MEQISLFDMVDNKNRIVLTSTIDEDTITERISKVFDYKFDGTIREEIKIPVFPKEFQIGLIVGSSGSGKSTIAQQVFGEETLVMWDSRKCVASHFKTYEEAVDKLGAVGLNSIPTWLKPYYVLSTGEKFRADMARRLENGSVIDEFTSVVNREVAKSCSMSISKYIRNHGLQNVVFCSCHDDIAEYLEPDWVYNTDTKEFVDRGLLRRREISVDILPCKREAWNMFKQYHYLSGDLNSAARCYIAVIGKQMVGFVAVLSLPGQIKNAYREHRLVVHPDFQGMGVGNKLSEAIASAYVNMGCRYFSKTSNPRVGLHREKSDLWKPTSKNKRIRKDYIRLIGTNANERWGMSDEKTMYHAERVCWSHEYVGNGKN